jgi:hypothetical protein
MTNDENYNLVNKKPFIASPSCEGRPSSAGQGCAIHGFFYAPIFGQAWLVAEDAYEQHLEFVEPVRKSGEFFYAHKSEITPVRINGRNGRSRSNTSFGRYPGPLEFFHVRTYLDAVIRAYPACESDSNQGKNGKNLL